MKKFYLFCLMVMCGIGCLSLNAKQKTQSSAALVMEITQLRHSKMPLMATMPAVELLNRNPNHAVALSFFRKDFEEAEQKIQEELELIAFANTLEEAQRRYELVKLLADAYEALALLELPLVGDGWSWHPGIKYYAGSVSEAQTDLIQIAEDRAKEAANRNNPQEAYRCYNVALECLLDSGEIASNRQHYATMLKRRGDEVYGAGMEVSSLVVASEFYDVASKINPDDAVIKSQKDKCAEEVESILRQQEDGGVNVDTIAYFVPENVEVDKAQKEKYTFDDFFNALDLPTVLGVGFAPNGIEGATFNSAMRLGWRQHKNYGLFSYITYDTHSHAYDSLEIKGSNVRTGEVWYNEIGISVGYRLPLVANIRSFYQNPYFHPWDFFVSAQPGISIATVKNMVSYDENPDAYVMKSCNHVVPTMRFSAGVERFIFSNFAVFAEASYTQHITPTIIEQAAIKRNEIRKPTGPVILSVGLSLFFT